MIRSKVEPLSIVRLLLLVATFVVMFASSPAVADSAEKIVKVGWYHSDMFQEGMSDDEPKRGYAYEYLLKIADYSGWQFSYEYGQWVDLLEKLENGDIDVLAGVSYTKERSSKMLFPIHAMGTDRYYLYQHDKKRTMDVSDITTFIGKKIGCINNNRMTTHLIQWAEENQASLDYIYYDGFRGRDEDFTNGKLDGIVATDNNINTTVGYSPVAKVGEEPFYLAVAKKRKDLLTDLNRSLEILQEMNPYFLQSLQYKSYGATMANSQLSEEELQWVSTHDTLRIGYLGDYLPYSKSDKDGNAYGLITEVMDAALDHLKLRDSLVVSYQSFYSFQPMIDALTENQIDAIFPIGGQIWDIDRSGMNTTTAVVSTGLDLVYQGNLSQEKIKLFAINKNNELQEKFVKRNYPDAEILYKNSIEDALYAVKNENAVTIINGLRVNLIRSNSEFNNLSLMQLNASGNSYLGVKKGNVGLLLLLNRGLKLTGRDFGINTAYKYMDEFYNVTFIDFVKSRIISIGSIFLGIMLLIIILLNRNIYHTKKDALEKERLNKKLEFSRKQAEEANNAKTTFLFNMSHDIRTPMNAIIGFTDLLQKYQEDPEKRNNYLKKIQDSSTTLLSIINNVLEMARIEKGAEKIEENAWSTEQFNDTLFSVFQEMMKNKGIKFTRTIEVQHHNVLCDTIKMREIFLNILSNAYKYTTYGGSVHMNLKELPYNTEGWCLYQTTITDTGCGMSKEFLPHVFEEFARENTSIGNRIEGSGLGMSIVKRLVDLMNGTIEVHSEKGIGTTCIVTVPHKIAREEDLLVHANEKFSQESFKGYRVLLAEDNDLNAEITTTLLTEVGFAVDRAVDGHCCAELLSKASDNYYNIILMDIQMPKINGYEATRIIRSLSDTKKATIPIIALTANAFEEDKRAAFMAGMNGHLSKPINVKMLLQELTRILGNQN
ncbi:ATP-binding protein [Fibrobacter sp. HC4]|uniref:ATP-binding protein n=1 Tax=Fibrobacter sp. HC4 TaxID=3239812 RepID=UPI002019B1EF|nr:transporter substrate-binding domain-containing protein [Fibrobacter succinogenes]MCL4101963.1 Sensor histidine kinase RcsC [Fibrobacter succinogenes]